MAVITATLSVRLRALNGLSSVRVPIPMSLAKWLAVAALPPLPMKMILAPPGRPR
jgi:hypothetical protein